MKNNEEATPDKMKIQLTPLYSWSPDYLQQLDPDFVKWLVAKKPGLYNALLSIENRQELTEKEKTLADLHAAQVYDGYKIFKSGIREKSMESVQATQPTRTIINNSKVANCLPTVSRTHAAQIDLGKNEGGNISAIVKLNIVGDNGIVLPSNITPYDKAILDAVCTMVDAGNKYITPTQIYKIMNGKTGNVRVRDITLKKIEDSLIKQMRSFVTVDYTKQIQDYIKDEPESEKEGKRYVVQGNLLNLQKETVLMNGVEVDSAFRVLSIPILLNYARSINQILYIPVTTYDIGSALKSTPEITVLTQIITRELLTMRHVKKRNNKMRYEYLFNKLEMRSYNAPVTGENKDYKVLSATQITRYRQYIAKILESLATKPLNAENKSGTTFLKKFKEYKAGRSVIGVEIEL